MALLGSSVDPRLFVQDYSGFARAAEIQGQGMANLGKGIAQGIEQYGAIKKENAQLTGQIKGIEKQIDSAINLFPERKAELEAMKISINDPNKSLRERFGEASTYNDLISNSLNMMKAQTQLGIMRQREARAASSGGGGSATGGGAAGESATSNINPFTGQPY